MGPEEKLTKQGVRDLNYLVPKKKRVVEVVAEPVVAEPLPLPPPPAAVPDSVALPPPGE